MKTFIENSTAAIASTSAGTIKHDGEFAGHPFFKCSNDSFQNCVQGRTKHKKWKNFIKDENVSNKIKTYMKDNKGKAFLLQNERTGEMVFADKMFNI